MNKLIKWFLPKPEKMANIIVDEFAKVVNSSNKTDVIAKYGTITSKVVSVANDITKVIRDGTISNEEKMLLADKLIPVMEKIMEKI